MTTASVLSNVAFLIGSINVSNLVKSLDFNIGNTPLNATTFTDAWNIMNAGLRNANLGISGLCEATSATSIDTICWGGVNASPPTIHVVKFLFNGIVASPTNPAIQGNFFISNYKQSAATDSLIAFSADFSLAGPLTRLTA